MYLRIVIFFLLTISISSEILATSQQACEYNQHNNCSYNEQCLQANKNQFKCFVFPAQTPVIYPPFAKGTQFSCSQGVLSKPNRTHSWRHMGYALDLVVSPDTPIFAGIDGIVVSFKKCVSKDPKGENNTDCGGGFGNYIKIVRDDGYILFYAHLKKVLVNSGQRVKVGEQIGVVGNTGAAGHIHLHTSLHFVEQAQLQNYIKNSNWLPTSVPYVLSLCREVSNKCLNLLSVRDFQCAESNSAPQYLIN